MTVTQVSQPVFVFGSNLGGRHGAGAAKVAKHVWDADYGVGVGPTGMSYAIPTKDEDLNVLPLNVVGKHVRDFIRYASDKNNKDILFYVTAFGTGLAGNSKKDILALFGDIQQLPYNIVFTKDWFFE